MSVGVIYQGAAGRIHSDSEANFSTDSSAWIASMTKIVTSVAIMRIVEKGLVGLDDDVRPLVPQLAKVQILRGFVGNDIPYLLENKTPITLRYMSPLCHSLVLSLSVHSPVIVGYQDDHGS